MGGRISIIIRWFARRLWGCQHWISQDVAQVLDGIVAGLEELADRVDRHASA